MQLRQIQPLLIPQDALEYNTVQNFKPEVILVNPSSLYVDENYQRELTRKSTLLITKIIREWSWNAFKPPIVVKMDDDSLHIIDGQHTAIAAATHPDIKEIPVFVVKNLESEERADSFVRHNIDRTAVNPVQLFKARLEAGEDLATSVNMALQRSGVKLVHTANFTRGIGECSAVASLDAICDRNGTLALRRILDICVAAELRPIQSYYLHALESILFKSKNKEEFDVDGLSLVIKEYPYDKLCSDIELVSRQKGIPKKSACVDLIRQQYEQRFR